MEGTVFWDKLRVGIEKTQQGKALLHSLVVVFFIKLAKR